MRNDTLVINFTNPEVNYLAAALARTSRLRKYVRPYANFARPLERAIAQLPGSKNFYAGSFGRRTMPPELNPANVREVAVLDFLLQLAIRSGSSGLAKRLYWRVQRELAQIGSRYAKEAGVVVGGYGVSEPAFLRTSGLKLLNYPITHHRYTKKFLLEEAELEPEWAKTSPELTPEPPWFEAQLDNECRLADRILVGSSFARDSFVAEGFASEKMIVIPYGVDTDLFVPSFERTRSKKKFRVLFVGQIGQRKGIAYLMRAYQQFKGNGTTLTLVGSFQGDARCLATSDNVFEHIPHVPLSALPAIYQEADVFVFPTLLEGLGLVVLEAMASGLPVITTPRGPDEIVRDGVDGFIVPIRNAEAIAERLEFFRANPHERIRMGRNARERALTFTWSNYQRRIVDLLGFEGVPHDPGGITPKPTPPSCSENANAK